MDDEELEAFARSRVGTRICGRWKLDELLGVGGTASVYAATHRKGKRVAVKILHPDLSANKQFRDRFLREGYVGNLIQHEGAVTVYDDDETSDGCALLVMDLLDGENFEVRRGRKGGTLEPLEVLSLMDDVLDTLRVAHEKGVVHRDIKPENLFLTKAGPVKLLDFGIAHINVPKDPSATLAGVAMGTPAFMPPEQASARWSEVDERSDIWALGASMFTLLAGRYVHEGGTINESLALAVTQEPPSLGVVAPHLPLPVVEVVDRALRKKKEERWNSAAEMQIAIRIAYRELQGDLPDGERYSLSHGRVRQHSAPPSFEPAGLRSESLSSSSATEDPVSADVAHLKRGPHQRKWVIAALALSLFALFAVLLSSGEDSPDPAAVAARPGDAPLLAQSQTPSAQSSAPSASAQTNLAAADSSAQHSVANDEENGAAGQSNSGRERRAKDRSRYAPPAAGRANSKSGSDAETSSGTSGSPGSGTGPASGSKSGKAPAVDFDPLSHRE